MTNFMITNYVTITNVAKQSGAFKGEIADLFFTQILIYAIIASVISYGIIETIRKINDKFDSSTGSKAGVILSLSVVYIMGIVFGFLLKDVNSTFQNITFGITIGSTAVMIYKMAIKGVLELVPVIFEKFKSILQGIGK